MQNVIFLFFVLFLTSFAQQIGDGSGIRRCPANMIQLFNGISCSKDEQCQNLAVGFFCYQGYCCANNNNSPSGYGTSCSFDSQCFFANSQCRSNVCYCRQGYNYDGSQCVYSSGSSGCSTCNVCAANQVLIDSVCFNKAGYYDSCTFVEQCNFTGATCSNFKCICQIGRIYNGFSCVNDPDANYSPGVSCASDEIPINGKCYPSVGRGQSCVFDEQCILEVGLICQNGFCVNRKFGDVPPIGDGTNPIIEGPGPVISPPEPVRVLLCCYSHSSPCCISCCRSYDIVSIRYSQPWRPPPPPPNPNQGNCGTNQVQVNGQCWPTSLPGGTCRYDLQCTDLYANRPMICNGGICRWLTRDQAFCQNPNAAIERINGVIKNCLYQDCSFGYQCEYNAVFNQGQYICCGTTFYDDGNNGNQLGQPKYNLGQRTPLECRAINACTYVDYPHCVYSQTWKYKVCCSTKYCA